jgi:hypothetical protein
MSATELVAELQRAPRVPRAERVTGALRSCPGAPLSVSELSGAAAAALGLEPRANVMYLRLQRPRTWSAARRRRIERRAAGRDADTFWEDAPDCTADEAAGLLPLAGELLELQGTHHRAQTRVLCVEPLPHGPRIGAVVVGCQRVYGLRVPRAA